MRSSELKGEFLVCESCGFKLHVAEKWEACEPEARCSVDIICCGKPMKVNYPSLPN